MKKTLAITVAQDRQTSVGDYAPAPQTAGSQGAVVSVRRRVPLGLCRMMSSVYQEHAGICLSDSPTLVHLLR